MNSENSNSFQFNGFQFNSGYTFAANIINRGKWFDLTDRRDIVAKLRECVEEERKEDRYSDYDAGVEAACNAWEAQNPESN